MLATGSLTSKLVVLSLLLMHACCAQVAMADEKSRVIAQTLPQFSGPIMGSSFSRTPSSHVGFGGGTIDLNGDGIEEIVQPISVYPGWGITAPQPLVILGTNKSSGSYSAGTVKYLSTKPPKQVHSRTFAVADFNKDGISDYFLGGHGWDEYPYPREPDYFLMSERKRGTILHKSVRAEPGIPTYTHDAASGDINNDHVPDLFVGISCCYSTPNTQGPYFLMGVKGGTPVFSNNRLNDTVSKRNLQYLSASLVDVNDDGSSDLVLGSDEFREKPTRNVIYLNDGQGFFTQSSPDVTLPVGLFGVGGTYTVDVLSADLDTDGHSDLLLLQTPVDPFYVGYGIQVLINKSGSFLDESWRLLDDSGLQTSGDWRESIIVADFYGDGLVDFVVHRSCDGNKDGYLVWLNDGSGQFSPHSAALYKSSFSYGCYFIYPVDFNNDGRSDIVDVYSTSGSEAVAATYQNDGIPSRSRSTKPIVVRQPASQSAVSGAKLTLSASVRGSRPLRFQWFKDGKAVQGATRPVLVMPSLRNQQVGTYKLRITNAAGSTFTNTVSVSVSTIATTR